MPGFCAYERSPGMIEKKFIDIRYFEGNKDILLD